jgi:hypothetical protein
VFLVGLEQQPSTTVTKLPAILHRSRHSAMTLVEVAVAMGVMSIMMGGILAALMQTRRLGSASVAQSCALTVVQGYIEQLKNMPLQQFVNSLPTDPQDNPNLTASFILDTVKDQSLPIGGLNPTSKLATTPTTTTLTTGTAGLPGYYTSLAAEIATLTGATPGVTPAGVEDNLQRFDMDSRTAANNTTWAAIWPGANTALSPYPAYNASYPNDTNWQPGTTDLRMNFWVKIFDLTPTASSKCKAYGFIIVYTWQYLDGARIRYAMDSVRSVRSAVPTY